jgi:hypothetical protein
LPFLPLFHCVLGCFALEPGIQGELSGVPLPMRGKSGNDRGKNGKGGNTNGNVRGKSGKDGGGDSGKDGDARGGMSDG